MTRYSPLIIVLLAALFAVSGLYVKPPGESETVRAFGRLPILAQGRLKPLDSVARSTLLLIQGRQTVRTDDGAELTPDRWLLDAMFYPARADTYRTFVIDNTDLQALIGKTDENLTIHYEGAARQTMALLGMLPTRWRRFSFAEILPHIPEIEAQYKLAEPVEAQARTFFQASVVQLYDSLTHYVRVRRAVLPDEQGDFVSDLLHLQESMADGIEAVRAKEAGRPFDAAKADAILRQGQRFLAMSEATDLLLIPPADGDRDPSHWRNTGQALLESFGQGSVNPTVVAYAGIGYAWRKGDERTLSFIVGKLSDSIERRYPEALKRSRIESLFNAAEPFYSCMMIYVAAFGLALVSWLRWREAARTSAWGLVSLAWILSTLGLVARMWLESRPPVTNLYSSALFIGWLGVALCLYLEATHRNAIGSAAAGVIGFATLLIAHHLSLAGDTMEMMRAVLDSNFWLATHVLVVTAGYAATFLAGVLAIIYVVAGLVSPSSVKGELGSTLSGMVYGIVCFATLFSFTGTTLGGIWADQSWGRFWGWDPKENGALIIVLWNALILHARWGGLVRERGLMCLAIFGNIVTGWSWFGTNMLGIGLHSYGFTQAAFWWLSAFIGLNLALIAVALLPRRAAQA